MNDYASDHSSYNWPSFVCHPFTDSHIDALHNPLSAPNIPFALKTQRQPPSCTTKMRKGLIIFLSINALIVIFLIRSVFTLLTLLVEDGSADAIHSAEIPAPNSPLIDDRPQLIPKIIHQTYVNDSVPEHWREAQRSCIDLHEDYEYKVCHVTSPLRS